ncbi:MAG: nucleotidyltransferase substrate binding protein [Candidatus Terrybacteria bacterium]|nr:nucleotidyltransferase substrate binding protein [Candidatus Terrybacteria bacterium]
MTKYEALFQEFNEALKRFEEVLQEEKTEFIRDSAIKRFELVFDLSWKTIKAWLEEKGVSCASPLNCFKEAYHQGIIDFVSFLLTPKSL